MKEKEIRCVCGNIIKYNDSETGRKFEVFCNNCAGRHWIKEDLKFCPDCGEELMSLSDSGKKYCEKCKRHFS